MIIDTHQHLWKLDRDDYTWLTPDLELLGVDSGRGQDRIISPAVRAVAANHSLLRPTR